MSHRTVKLVCAVLTLLFPLWAWAANDKVNESLEATDTKHRSIVNAHLYPWSAIGRVNLSGRGHCTGTLIGERLVLTAAHCVYFRANKDWFRPSSIYFVAGYQRDTYLAVSQAEMLYPSPGFDGEKWNDNDNIPNDWALILLKKPIGKKVGYLGWTAMDPNELQRQKDQKSRFLLAGYPRDRAHAISVDKDCVLEGFLREARLIGHRCKIVNGDSGGPIAQVINGRLSVIAVNSAVYGTSDGDYSVAVPITQFQSAIKTLLGEDYANSPYRKRGFYPCDNGGCKKKTLTKKP